MAEELLQSKTEGYSQILKKIEDLPYLSKNNMTSNLNSPQCLYYKCKEAKIIELDQSEPVLPFKISLKPYNSSEYEKEEGDKDAIKINLSLVISLC